MKNRQSMKDGGRRRKQLAESPLKNALIGALLMSPLVATPPAYAIDFDTGNQDVKLNMINTFSLNLATRLQNRSHLIDTASGGTFSQSNAYFGSKGDITAERLDLLSEVNFSYKKRYGFRVSGAGWYDRAYGDHPATGGSVVRSYYVNDEFTPIVKRFYAGPSAEFLDAYVYGRFDLGPVPVDIRFGKQAVIWGESLFGSTNAIAYSQAPSDGRKALVNPAAAAKETALATRQISFISQPFDTITFAGHYTFDWKPNRSPEGGTYFGASDILFAGPNVGRGESVNGNGGDIGLLLRWMPDFMDSGAFGFYYRRFDEKNPYAAQPAAPGASGTRLVYAPDLELFGLSVSKVIGVANVVEGISVGAEVSYRRNMPLVTRGGTADGLGARGETLHALLNASKSFGESSWYSTASLAAEIGFSHLVKVTSHPEFYRTVGNAAAGCATDDVIGGCASRNFYSLGVSYSPEWQQIVPGVTLTAPVFYSINFKGNAPTNSGGNQGFQTLKVGLSALYDLKHRFDLSGTFYKGRTDSTRVLGAPYNDKAYLALTYTTYF